MTNCISFLLSWFNSFLFDSFYSFNKSIHSFPLEAITTIYLIIIMIFLLSLFYFLLFIFIFIFIIFIPILLREPRIEKQLFYRWIYWLNELLNFTLSSFSFYLFYLIFIFILILLDLHFRFTCFTWSSLFVLSFH